MILEESLRNLEVGVRSGGTLVSHRPLFTKDSKQLLVVSVDTVHFYSPESFEPVGLFQTPTASPIANIALCPAPSSDHEELVVLTEAGDLFHVSLDTHEAVSAHNVKQSLTTGWTHITKWLNVTHLRNGTLLIAGHPENTEEVLLYEATKDLESRKERYTLEKICWKILPTTHAVAVGASGHLVVAIQTDSVFMTNLSSKVSKWHKSGTRAFTCVAAHPHEWVVATGDDSGRILLWRNFLEDKSPPKAVFHWHSLPVADLCFSTDGSKLLSGGGECCLVRWDTADSSDRKILPRMGLPIRHIAASHGNTMVAVSHADNCIQLVDEGQKVLGMIQNITQCYIPESGEDDNVSPMSLGGSSVFEAGLTLDPNRKSLLMNGKPGHLQSYSLREDKHLYDLDITQENYVTAERKKSIPNAHVSHVAFSSHGVWLGTVETLLHGSKYHALRLKFWKFQEEKQTFVLNTSINWPHENGVVKLRIQPGDEKAGFVVAATSGGDRRFRTWGLLSDSSIHGKSEWWTCENVGSYKEQSAGPLTFSHDGSVLAASFAHTLTLWKTDSHELSGTLCHSKLKEHIVVAEFSAHPSSNLVVCGTKRDLVVWDVITLSLLWRVPLSVESLAVDSLTNLVAVFSSKRHLYFFKPEAPEPLAVHKSVSRSKVISSIFVENPFPSRELLGLKSMLIFINSSQELCGMLSRERSSSAVKSVRIRKGLSTLTPFAKLLAEKTVSSVRESVRSFRNVLGIPGAQVIREMMDISPQTHPSIAYFCNQFLSAISVQIRESEKIESMAECLDPSTLYHVSSDTETESESDDDVLSEDEIFGRKTKGPRRTSETEKGAEVAAPTNLSSTNAKSGSIEELKADLDSVANDDISWIKQGVVT